MNIERPTQIIMKNRSVLSRKLRYEQMLIVNIYCNLKVNNIQIIIKL